MGTLSLRKWEDKLNGVVLVSEKDQVLYKEAYGYTDASNKLKNTMDTKFLICSISKMFTAVAINQLSERGLLHKEDLLNQYIPDYFKGKGITLYHLLTHTSGIPNYTMYRKELQWTKAYTAQEVLECMDQKGLKFEPGKKTSYSNTNYYILALVVEQVTGMKYEAYVTDNIFKVAGMSQSSFVTCYEGEMAKPHNKGKFEYDFSDTLLFGAGDVISTAGDLRLFARALIENKLISQATLEEMSKAGIKDSKIQYGEGLFINRHFGKLCIGHSGSIPNGGTTQLMIYPEAETIIIVLLNNRNSLHPLVYVDANGQYVANILAEQIFERKLGLIKKAYF